MSELSTWAAQLLHALGWLETLRPAFSDLAAALEEYQGWHGLEVTGELDGPTRRSLATPRFCGFPDRMELDTDLPRWGVTSLTWAIDGAPLPGMNASQHKDAIMEACSAWPGVCGIRLEYSPNVNTANIVMGSGRIDGPLGTLAWSELPGPGRGQVNQRYDTSETWSIYEGPIRRQSIDPVRVMMHEVGHALGLAHGPAGCLMAPTISEIRRPQGWDIAEAQKRYPIPAGPTQPAPPAPPTGPAPGGPVRIEVFGEVRSISIPGYRVTKLA